MNTAVKIKNLNRSHMGKSFNVKGRTKFLDVHRNRHSEGTHLKSILFDKSSEIEIVAFSNCEDLAQKLKTDNVVQISNASLKEVNKDFKKTKHKYQIILESNSIISSISNEEVNIDEFPYQKYTPGSDFKSLLPGIVIDVIGVCVQFNNSIYSRSSTYKSGIIKVDSTEIEFRLYDEKINEVFDVGCKLSMSCVIYKNFKGSVYLLVGRSSSVVKYDPQPLLNDIDRKPFIQGVSQQLEKSKEICQDLVVESPDQRPSTSSSMISNQNSVIRLPGQGPSVSTSTSFNDNLGVESPDRRLSASCSTPSSNKRKTHDFSVEEVASKFPKITESDQMFFGILLNLLANVNNKDAVKMRILECAQNYIDQEESNN